jgi:RimJ/RimL family protein N-acetyltransferase
MTLFETPRLAFRPLTPADAPFIVALVNDPDWLRFIGDRNVRSVGDAVGYIRNGPMASYARHGFGLWRAALRDSDTPIGICGLLQRDVLPHPDLGFAYLPAHRGRGYGVEAATATLAYGRKEFGFRRVLAFTSPENERSMALLRKAGMRFEGTIRLARDQGESRLFAVEW